MSAAADAGDQKKRSRPEVEDADDEPGKKMKRSMPCHGVAKFSTHRRKQSVSECALFRNKYFNPKQVDAYKADPPGLVHVKNTAFKRRSVFWGLTTSE